MEIKTMLPLPDKAYADHSSPAYSKEAVLAILNGLGFSYKYFDEYEASFIVPSEIATKPQRITEQDAQKIIADYEDTTPYVWFESERAITLAKLNEHREPEANPEASIDHSKSQQFERFERLTHHILMMASTGTIGSPYEWDEFLAELNNALEVTANKAEVLARKESDQIINVERLGDQSVKLVFSSCRAASSFYTEALEQIPPLKDGAQ